MVKVGALPLDALMFSLQEGDRLVAAPAALLAARYPTVRLGKSLLGLPIVTRVLDHIPIGGDEKHREAHVNAGLASRRGQRLGGHLRTRDAGVPAIRFPPDGHRLRRPLQRTMQPDEDTANLRQAEHAAVKHRAVAILRIGEAVVAGASLKARIAWFLTRI
jgi:hypothetical protein